MVQAETTIGGYTEDRISVMAYDSACHGMLVAVHSQQYVGGGKKESIVWLTPTAAREVAIGLLQAAKTASESPECITQ